MDAPFVTPAEPSAAEAVAALKDEFEFFDDWMDRYEQVIDWGRALPAFPDAWKEPSRKVEGCQSQVWMIAHASADVPPRLEVLADSDAFIVKGLIGILLMLGSFLWGGMLLLRHYRRLST